MAENKCYICGTTEGVTCRNFCELQGSKAQVGYCNSCALKYVNPTWSKIPEMQKGDWIKNEASFWSLFDDAKIMCMNDKGNLRIVVGGACPVSDPYKEHREKIEKSHEFDRWKLNQERCELCGEDGTYENIVKCEVKNDNRMHFNCFQTTQRMARILNVSFEVALEKLKALINHPPKKIATKKQCEIKCFGDFSQNPWNR